MKKYCQLLLLIGCILSLTLLLIYRHQYNRLHYVLEVFNFFGQPCNISELELTENVAVQHDWGPVPLWQSHGPIHTYSGYWMKKNVNDDKSKGYAEVIVANREKTYMKGCYLWEENEKNPIIGKFMYSKISENLYFYSCYTDGLEKNPYAVSFLGKLKNPIRKILLKTPSEKISFNTTVCVLPSANFSKNEFLEFLSFHTLVGIDSYIFYTDNISHRLQKIIVNLSSRLNIKVTFFPWNLNVFNQNFTRDVIEQDCLLRALSNSKNVISLALNEYLVPSAHITLNELFNNYQSTPRIRLPIQTFCIRNIRQKKPIALQNTEVTYFNDNSIRMVYRNVKDHVNHGVKSVNKHTASIHNYLICNQSGRSYNDNIMLRYSTDFLRSTLMQLYLHDHI
ncbi:uncharacterized protein [Onthophagus taurus]|uniref:uncharacterized protein n=1 Tax=Onthophagus taurus TaxID=166361 RepID=UPI000C202335|nr:uncharacterized protein LOC111425215 [Onthophagus taurus]